MVRRLLLGLLVVAAALVISIGMYALFILPLMPLR